MIVGSYILFKGFAFGFDGVVWVATSLCLSAICRWFSLDCCFLVCLCGFVYVAFFLCLWPVCCIGCVLVICFSLSRLCLFQLV